MRRAVWQHLCRTLRSESSIHSYPVSRVKSHPQFPHLATTLVNHTCLVDHSNPPIVKQIVTCRTPNPTFRTVVRQHLLFLGKSEETLEPGFLPKFIHRSQISINGYVSRFVRMNHVQGILVGIFWFWKTPRIWCRRNRAFGHLNYLPNYLVVPTIPKWRLLQRTACPQMT